MDNYYYIVAGLPVLNPEWKPGDAGIEGLIEEIMENCSEKDRETISFLEDGFDDGKLGEEFYRTALGHDNRFIREYFSFDLNVRNAKVRYLNRELGREPGKDVVSLGEESGQEEFEEAGVLDAILQGKDILARERGLDDLMWEKIDEITTFDYFDIEAILAFLAKLHIVRRWYILDENTGREMFRKLVNEVRGTFKGVEYNG